MLFKENVLAGSVRKGILSASGIINRKHFQKTRRYFTEFLSSVNSYGELTDTITLTGDFEIEVDYEINSGTEARSLLSGVSGNDFRLVLFDTSHATNPARVEFVYNSNFSGTNNAYDVGLAGKLAKVRVTRVSNLVSVYVNEVLAHQVVTTDSIIVDKVGSNSDASSLFIDSYLANLKITDAGTLAGFWSMDDAPNSTYFRNTAAVLGSELWTGTPNIGTGWVDNGDGSYSIDGTQVSSSYLRFTGKVTIGDSYLVGVTIEAISGGSAFFDVGGAFTTGFTTIGNHSITVKAVNDSDLALGVAAGQTATVRLITAKEIPATTPYLTKQNIASDQTELFDQVNGEWTGEEGWLVGDIVANGTEPLLTNLGLQSSPRFKTGDVVRYSYYQDIVTPRLQFIIGNTGPTLDSVGLVTDSKEFDGSLLFFRNLDDGAEGTVTQISVKRLLQEATQ